MQFLRILLIALITVTLIMLSIAINNTINNNNFKCEYEIEIVNDSMMRIRNTQSNQVVNERIDNFEEFILTDNQ